MKTKAEMRALIDKCRSKARDAPYSSSRSLLHDTADALEQAIEAMPERKWKFSPEARRALRAGSAAGLDSASVIRSPIGNDLLVSLSNDQRYSTDIPVADLLADAEPEPELSDSEIFRIGEQHGVGFCIGKELDAIRAVIRAHEAKRNG
jgi:hypothetical protein